MSDNSAGAAGLLIVLWIVMVAPNNEQYAVDAMYKCRAINADTFALYDCMNYQGFRVAEPGGSVTEVTNYVTMYAWEHGALKRSLDAIHGWIR